MATAAAAATMTTPTTERPRIVCADAGPEPPFPLRMEGRVISGFGRGSKELGIPTANLPVDGTAVPWIEDAKSGVYFGYASLALPAGHPDRLPGVATSSSSSSSSAAAAGAAQQRKEQQQEPSTSSTSSQQSPTATAGGNDDNDNNDSSNSSGEFQVYPMVMSIGYNPFYKNTVRSAEVHVLHAFRADFYGAHMRLLLLGYVRDELDYSGLEALVRDINIDCDVARNSLARRAWRPREGVIVAAAAAEGEGGAAGAAGGQGGDDEKKIVERGSLDGSWLVRPLDEGAAV